MKSIFRYPGGKSKAAIQSWILSHMPEDTEEYREPFVGGGGVFFGINRPGLRYWLNDKHCGLIEVYKALRDRPEEFIVKCREIAPASEGEELTEEGPRGGQPQNKRLKDFFEYICLNEEADQALRYYFVNRTVHGSGRVNYDIPSRLYFSNPEGWNVTTTPLLEQAATVLDGVKLTCGDYSELLEADGENVWIYCDPPYVVNTNLTRTSQLYQHGFTLDDHKRFAEAVKACRHKVCISYDDDGEGVIRSLFPESEGFWIVDASWRYAGTTNETKEHGKELLILNYDPADLKAVSAPESYQVAVHLDKDERATLKRLEKVIEEQVRGFVEVGKALRAIRDSGQPSKRLYRENYETFDDYCQGRWQMSKNYADKLIRGVARLEALEMGTNVPVLPEREAHVRELCKIESDTEAAEVWQQVVESVDDPSEITAKLIKEHVNAHLGIEKPERDPYTAFIKAWEKLDATARQRFIQEQLGKDLAA